MARGGEVIADAGLRRRGLMLILSSPSGAGNTTLSRRLLELDGNLEMSISATTRRKRQRSMVRWLLPFGFFAGFTFTFVADLDTFSFAGSWGNHLICGLLGLISGWMGSFAAAASVASDDDDRIRTLRNRVGEGNWLLLAETSGAQELPWSVVQQAKPMAVIQLEDAS